MKADALDYTLDGGIYVVIQTSTLVYWISSGPRPGKLVITWQLYAGKLPYRSFVSVTLGIWK